MRQRLSWDQEKKAGMSKKADPYTMNQEHMNPPVGKYDIGGPSEFAEDPDMRTPWKTEGRLETGHPAPTREAVKSARQLEDKALKCITIAQRMLPNASDEMIEEQATDMMYMPEKAVLATLQRQTRLAETLAAAKDEDEDEEKEAGKKEEMKEEEEKEAAKKDKEEEEKEAGKKEKMEEEEKEAGKKEKMKEEEEKEAAKKEKEEEEEKEAAKKNKEEEEKTKSAEEDVDLLDSIFANEEKTGAKKLSGIVKQASSENSLDKLWSSPPDVSEAFK